MSWGCSGLMSPAGSRRRDWSLKPEPPHVLCHQNLFTQHDWTCPLPLRRPHSPVYIQLSTGAQHTHGIGGLLWGHMDHCPLGHRPASSSLQLQAVPGLVPLSCPLKAMSQHLWFVAQQLSPSPLRSQVCTLRAAPRLHWRQCQNQ